MMTLPKFAVIKSNCRICIADLMCPEHRKIWDDMIKDKS